VQFANEAIVGRARHEEDLRGMGTTICALAQVDFEGEPTLSVVNVGDSRAYLLKAGEFHLEQITEDHSLVATLERSGQLTREEAAQHPQRNILTRALGIDSRVLVDSWEILPVEGDRYLLCSDGLFNEVSEAAIAAVLRRLADPRDAARELVRMANENGGHDNISVVIVDIVSVGGEVVADEVVDDARDHPEGSADRITRVVHGVEREDGQGDGPTAADIEAEIVAVAASRSGMAAAPLMPPTSEQPAVELPDAAEATDSSAAHATGGAVASPTAAGEPHTVTVEARDLAAALADVPPSPVSSAEPAAPTGFFSDTPPRRRLVTWRVVVFVVALLAVFGVAAAAVNWAATNSFFVQADAANGGAVTVFRGQPGGLLWIEPEVVRADELTLEQAPEEFRTDLENGISFDSEAEAEAYIDTVRARQVELAVEQSQAGTDDTGGSLGGAVTTTTTVPPGTVPVDSTTTTVDPATIGG
jgi:protein phosphatase